jgi:fumarate reductase subunit C
MESLSCYTLYHPKWYRRRVSVWWWLQKRVYAQFVLRELSSLFVAYFALLTLWMLRALASGAASYQHFQKELSSPGFLLLDFVAFVFVTFHSLTWFNLAPQAMAVRLAGKRVQPWAIQAANYAAWAVISAAVVWAVLKG